MKYFCQLDPSELRKYQLDSTRVKRDRYRPKLKEALEMYEKTADIEAVMDRFKYTKDGCYKMVRKARELKEKGEL